MDSRGTIDATKPVTEAKLPSLLPPLPTLVGHVNGPYGANNGLTLNWGTIPVNALITMGSMDTRALTNKTINHSSNHLGGVKFAISP